MLHLSEKWSCMVRSTFSSGKNRDFPMTLNDCMRENSQIFLAFLGRANQSVGVVEFVTTTAIFSAHTVTKYECTCYLRTRHFAYTCSAFGHLRCAQNELRERPSIRQVTWRARAEVEIRPCFVIRSPSGVFILAVIHATEKVRHLASAIGLRTSVSSSRTYTMIQTSRGRKKNRNRSVLSVK